MKYILNAVLLSIFAMVSLYASGLKTAAPVVKSKPIMTVEYEYSKSGRITARKINGQVQNYKYDKKGQLLGIYNDKGNAIEEYVYDPAGNILKKTIHGRTTTYKYDKANQLVLSECNGKITKYEYDAAGRLVKEGDKVYSYIGLDKIESVTENGRRLSSFTYHIDGQLAARVSIESSEEFQWDGLALIQRNSTNYVNEPAVTGGNPILADDKVLFNDMLGTTLGIKDGDKVMQNNLTAFGESLSASLMEDSFFTGKPHVGEMGYVFLFRAYRADQGKWQTSDPLGYPDGWNNFAYVNNQIITALDFLGALIINCVDGNNNDAIITNASQLKIGEFHREGNAGALGYFSYTYPHQISINATTKEVTINIVLSISVLANLIKSNAVSTGTIVEYIPHKTSHGDASLSNGFYECVVGHERGHVNSIIFTLIPRLRQELIALNIDNGTRSISEILTLTTNIFDSLYNNADILQDSFAKANAGTYAGFDQTWLQLSTENGRRRWIKE